MRILLDTNALIWLIDQEKPTSLGAKTLALIQKAAAIYVSPTSIVEMRIKSMIGKLEAREDLIQDIERAGIILTEFSAYDADMVQGFASLVRHDPFDRMILAQAKNSKMTLLTSDKALLSLNLNYVIDATM